MTLMDNEEIWKLRNQAWRNWWQSIAVELPNIYKHYDAIRAEFYHLCGSDRMAYDHLLSTEAIEMLKIMGGPNGYTYCRMLQHRHQYPWKHPK